MRRATRTHLQNAEGGAGGLRPSPVFSLRPREK
jgi:hypothetical protein